MFSRAIETLVKTQKPKARDGRSPERSIRTSTARASRKDSTTSDELADASEIRDRTPRSTVSSRDSDHTAGVPPSPRLIKDADRNYVIRSGENHGRKIDSRPATRRCSAIDDQHGRDSDLPQSSDESYQQFTSARRQSGGKNTSTSCQTKDGSQDPRWQKNYHSTRQSSDLQLADSMQDAQGLSKGVVSPASREDITSIINMVENEDYAGFGRCVNADLDLINKDEFRNTVRQRAVAALRRENQRQADGCIKTLVLVDICQTLSYDSATYFLLSLIREDDQSVLGEFARACARERLVCSNGPEAEFQNQVRAEHDSTHSRSPDQLNRRKREVAEATRDSRKMPRMLPDVTRANLKADFPEQPPAWFSCGKLFKMWKMLPVDDELLPSSSAGNPVVMRGGRTSAQLSSTAPSLASLATHAHNSQFRSIVYLVVVKQAPDFCVAIRARSYANSGFLREGLSPLDIRADAVIHSASSGPQSDEPQILKSPIKVDLAPHEGPLSMRIDFGRPFTVDHPIRAKEIGKVADESIVCFMKYCKEHML